jgi:hypothetical protein
VLQTPNSDESALSRSERRVPDRRIKRKVERLVSPKRRQTFLPLLVCRAEAERRRRERVGVRAYRAYIHDSDSKSAIRELSSSVHLRQAVEGARACLRVVPGTIAHTKEVTGNTCLNDVRGGWGSMRTATRRAGDGRDLRSEGISRGRGILSEGGDIHTEVLKHEDLKISRAVACL